MIQLILQVLLPEKKGWSETDLHGHHTYLSPRAQVGCWWVTVLVKPKGSIA